MLRDSRGLRAARELSATVLALALLAVLAGARSDALDEALRKYEALHSAIMRGDGVDRKFIVYEPPNVGLGNKVQCLTSVFLIALLTDRALLIMGTNLYDLDEILESPFAGGWNWHDVSAQFADATHAATQFFYWDAEDAKGVEPWLCDDFEALFAAPQRPTVVTVRATQATFFYTTQNPRMRDGVARLLGQPAQRPGEALSRSVADDLYGRLARFLVRPAPAVAAAVLAFRRRHWGNFTLGLQIRRHAGEQYLDDEGERATLQCARLVASERRAAAGGDVRVFLSTDWEPVRARAREALGEALVYRDVPVAHDPRDRERAAAAAVDFFLLAAADDLVVTAYSTFGFAAARLAGARPAAVLPVASDQFRGPVCARAVHDAAAAWHLAQAEAARCFDPRAMLAEAGLVFPRQWDRGVVVRAVEVAAERTALPPPLFLALAATVAAAALCGAYRSLAILRRRRARRRPARDLP